MRAPTLLSEKLRVPEARGLMRSRLHRQLLLGEPAIRLNLVIGPPGSGKSTLLADVAAESAMPVAWYRATAEDCSEQSLVAHVSHALEQVLGLDSAPRGMTSLLGAL